MLSTANVTSLPWTHTAYLAQGVPSTGKPLADFLLSPPLWWFLLAVWTALLFRDRKTPPVNQKKVPLKKRRPGSLYADGSAAGSKVENKIRTSIERMGYRLYPHGTAVTTRPDIDGKKHKYTPDIMVKRHKIIIEVDPQYTHGGAHRIAHDIDRNRAYAQLGYKIVRVRMGGARRLSDNDLLIDGGTFDHNEHKGKLSRAIRRARYFPPRYWKDSKRYITKEDIAPPVPQYPRELF